MIVWRLCKEGYEDLSGMGAFLYGGRWNSEGYNVVYCASSLSLSCLEILVGLPELRIPKGFVFLKLNIPESVKMKEFKGEISSIKRTDSCRKTGNAWHQDQASAVLIVPSVIIPQERNILINPRHPEAKEVTTLEKAPFEFDPRLLK